MSLRRQARIRREFIFKKSIEQRQKAIAARKQKLKECLEDNLPVPVELRRDIAQLERSIEFDDPNAGTALSSQDDEYRWAGVENPRIVITTSHNPSSKLKSFAKEMNHLFPNSTRINRGSYHLKNLMEACQSRLITDLIILHETRGVPDAMQISHLPYGPTAYFNLSQVITRHDVQDVGPMKEAYPHLIFDNFKTDLGKRVASILKYLFPVPKDDSKRIVCFANNEDFISFRHYVYRKEGLKDQIGLTEIGPRFEMRLFLIKLATIDQVDSAQTEWALRPFMNTAAKRTFL